MKMIRMLWALNGVPVSKGESEGDEFRRIEKFYELRDFHIEELLKLYGDSVKSYPETQTYYLNKAHAVYLQSFVEDALDFDLYDYYIELQAEYE
ncbi:MAG: hypothetical protein ABI876_13465 [Bacteroidota bacterium]